MDKAAGEIEKMFHFQAEDDETKAAVTGTIHAPSAEEATERLRKRHRLTPRTMLEIQKENL